MLSKSQNTVTIKINVTYTVKTAANVPFGISVEGLRRSPLILIPAKMPVIVGKKTPNTVNQL